MRPSRRALSLLLAGLSALPALPAGAAQEAAARYVLGGDAVVRGTLDYATRTRVDVVCGAPGTASVGGACFSLPDRAKRASLVIHDVSTRSVAGVVSFRTVSGAAVGRPSARFCGTTTVRVPRAADVMVVSFEQLLLPCATNGGVPTSGTVVATFR